MAELRAGFRLGQADGADLRLREHGGRDVGVIDLHLALAEHAVGERMALADRDRRQVEAMGDVADRVDAVDRALGEMVDRDAAVPRVDGDAGLLQAEIGDRGMAAVANITWSEARLDPFDRCVVNSSPCRSTFVTVQPVRMVMPCFSISARTWARTSSSKPRRMLSPR